MQRNGTHSRSLDRLLESEARLQSAVDLLGLGLYSWDPITNDLTWDTRLKAIWGLPPDAGIDYATWCSGIHRDDRERVDAAVAACIDPHGDGVYDIEYRVNGADGAERWVASRGKTTFTKGRATAFYGVAVDITARKHAEAELRTLNERLEKRVRERTAALESANRRLTTEANERQRANVLLQDLQLELFHGGRVSAIGQMAAALTHEISQPLTAAANFASTAYRALSGDAPAIGQACADLIEAMEQVFRAGQIIGQWREFVSCGETGRSAQSVPRMIDDAKRLAMLGTNMPGIKIRFELDKNAEFVLVDHIQIQQVLFNLLRNALEAMAGGPPGILEFRTKRLDVKNVEISVADNGPGMTGEIAAHLFEPFVSTKPNGMGLGLSICRSIIEAHGGTIHAQLRSEGGMLFSFTLPAAGNFEHEPS